MPLSTSPLGFRGFGGRAALGAPQITTRPKACHAAGWLARRTEQTGEEAERNDLLQSRAMLCRRMCSACLLLVATGCATWGYPSRVERRLHGQRQVGDFVSPYAYEHFIRAELAAARGDFTAALGHIQRARSSADDPLLLAREADLRDQLGQTAEALDLLRDAARDRPAAVIWMAMGRIRQRRGQAEDALTAYARAAARQPTSAEAPLAMAALLREGGRATEADGVLERFIANGRRAERGQRRHRSAGEARRAQQARATEEAHAARARLALAVQRRDPLAAEEAVEDWLALAPARLPDIRAAAQSALGAGQPDIALRLYRALPDTPRDRPARLRAALAAHDRERAEALLAAWMPRGAAELLEVARGYLAIHQPERAAELAEVALTADGGTEALLCLAQAHRKAGQLGPAAAVLIRIPPGTRAYPAAERELLELLRDAGQSALAAELQAHRQRTRQPAAHSPDTGTQCAPTPGAATTPTPKPNESGAFRPVPTVTTR